MKNLYVISGATGMTGNELSRQFVSQGDIVIGYQVSKPFSEPFDF